MKRYKNPLSQCNIVKKIIFQYFFSQTTFFIMDKLVSDDLFSLKGLWIAGFPTLMESFYVHDKLFKFHLPKLWKHFVRFFLSFSILDTKFKFFVTLEKSKNPPIFICNKMVHDYFPLIPIPYLFKSLGYILFGWI